MLDGGGLELLSRYGPPPYVSGLFPAQRAFVEAVTRRRVALCGRRAGKTEGVCAWLLGLTRRYPGEQVVYVARSQRSARRILWPVVRRIMQRYGDAAGVAELVDQSLEVRLRNGSTLWVTGVDSQADSEALRGSRYAGAAIDEAASFPEWLEYLVDDVLSPALMDLRGDLALCGTPGLVPAGFFWEVSTGDGERAQWPTFRWTMLDNPHVPGREELARVQRENRWGDDHPTLRREWLGEWVRDDSAIIYPYDPARNAGRAPEGASVYRVLSVDPGFDDPSAFVIATSVRGDPTIYVERAWRRGGLTVAGLAAQIDQARLDRERPCHAVVVDQGGLGRMIAEDLRGTYGIPCVAAQKPAKQVTIHEVRGAMLAGTVKVDPHHCQELIAEWHTVPWSDERDDHDPRIGDDLCDAMLYNFRAHRLAYIPEREPPSPESPEGRAAYKASRIAQIAAERTSRLRLR